MDLSETFLQLALVIMVVLLAYAINEIIKHFKKPAVDQYKKGFEAALESLQQGVDPKELMDHRDYYHLDEWDKGWNEACHRYIKLNL